MTHRREAQIIDIKKKKMTHTHKPWLMSTIRHVYVLLLHIRHDLCLCWLWVINIRHKHETHTHKTWLNVNKWPDSTKVCDVTHPHESWLINIRHDSQTWGIHQTHETWLIHRHDSYTWVTRHASYIYDTTCRHATRGGGLGSWPKNMYGERLGDGVEYHLMKPTPRR